jgi:hypothetical protein
MRIKSKAADRDTYKSSYIHWMSASFFLNLHDCAESLLWMSPRIDLALLDPDPVCTKKVRNLTF